MKDNKELKIATITTNMLAKYIYEGIIKLDDESLAKYEDLAEFQSHKVDIDVYDVLEDIEPRFYVSTSKSIIKALINMHSFEIQLSPIG
ncbi:hypothetical protein ACX9QY_004420 [Escherichia coli]